MIMFSSFSTENNIMSHLFACENALLWARFNVINDSLYNRTLHPADIYINCEL